MTNWRLYVSSGLFVLITVVKLMMPDATAQVRETVVELIDMDMDYTEMAIRVGRVLSDESVQEVLNAVRHEAEQVFGITENVLTPSPSVLPSEDLSTVQTPAPTAEPDATMTPSPAVSNSVLEAMEAFKIAQSAYADYDVPDMVSYENLVLPFSYTSPVEGVTSSGFGYRVHPIENVVKFHYGTDFVAAAGTPIAAFADGQVTMTGYEKGYGNFVEITHADGWKTLYAHCSEVKVSWWQDVKKGDIIALAGETGEATGPHLHLELTYNGLFTNPEFFF